MINYLKQYADKTYEELVNSLIWFDLSLKLKAIFAKIPTTFKTINNESIIGDGNIEITGGNGGNQDLQSVLNTGGRAEVDGGYSVINIFGNIEGQRFLNFYSSTLNDLSGAELTITNYASFINSYSLEEGTYNIIVKGEIKSIEGIINIIQDSNVSGTLKTSNVKIALPISDATYYIPAKSITGNYTINTTPDTIYTVDTLPLAVLNDMAIVSDATAPTYLGALVGGGTTITPVWYNGTSWVSR